MARFRGFALVCLLAACADVPDFKGNLSEAERNAPYPQLTSVEPLLSEAATTRANLPVREAQLDTLADRAHALQARAARLRGPVIEASRKTAMLAAMSRHALR